MSPSALVAPAGLIRDAGEWKPRRMGFVPVGTPLVCRRGHLADDPRELIDGMGGYDCRRRCEDAMCGWVVVVIEGMSLGSFRADLTADEWAEIRREQWRARQVLRYVGATLADASVA